MDTSTDPPSSKDGTLAQGPQEILAPSRERQRGGGEGQKGVASVGAMLYQKCDELTGSASRRVASEPTNR